jgi:hypothetical protein
VNTKLSPARKDFNAMYDANTLVYWSQRYPENIRWNYDNLLLAQMSKEEIRAVLGVKLVFPLALPAEFSHMPFAFYAFASPLQITLPIPSIRILDDLATASAYLDAHGYSQETIFDYIALLKYGSPLRCPGGVFPPPLTALQVPNNALDNHAVDNLSQLILKSCIVWILAHELGHIRFRHEGYPLVDHKQAQNNEKEADAFATELFRRAGVLPAGMTFLFMWFAHFAAHSGDYASDDQWLISVAEATHPLSTQRLKALAEAFRRTPYDFVATEPIPDERKVLRIANEIEQIARISEENSMQKFIRLRGLAASLEALAPRAIDDPFGPLRARFRSLSMDAKFDGLYEGANSRKLADDRVETLNACMLLERKGLVVTGRFNFGVGEGTLRGDVAGNVLTYEWKFGDAGGRGEFELDSSGGFHGEWGYEDSYTGGGSWTLQRATEAYGSV